MSANTQKYHVVKKTYMCFYDVAFLRVGRHMDFPRRCIFTCSQAYNIPSDQLAVQTHDVFFFLPGCSKHCNFKGFLKVSFFFLPGSHVVKHWFFKGFLNDCKGCFFFDRSFVNTPVSPSPFHVI